MNTTMSTTESFGPQEEAMMAPAAALRSENANIEWADRRLDRRRSSACSEITSPSCFFEQGSSCSDMLARNYQGAVECLVQAESVIASLQSKLDERDALIEEMREELVRTKLELASAKAAQDELRHSYSNIVRRRSSAMMAGGDDYIDDMLSDNDDEDDEKHGEQQQQQQPQRRRWSRFGASDPNFNCGASARSIKQQKRWSLSFGGGGGGGGVPDLDESSTSRGLDESCRTAAASALDESSSSRLSIMPGLGQLFRRDTWRRDEVVVDFEERRGEGGEGDLQRQGNISAADAGYAPARQDRCRRQTNKHRSERLKKSSRSFIDGVVFPSSFEDVISKGLDLEGVRASLKMLVFDDEQRRRIEVG